VKSCQEVVGKKMKGPTVEPLRGELRGTGKKGESFFFLGKIEGLVLKGSC